MRPLRLSHYKGYQLRPASKRHITTRPVTFCSIKYELLNRQPRNYTDNIFGTKSNQLSESITSLEFTKRHGHDALSRSGSHRVLLQGHHLLYLAPLHPSAALLPDGTDSDHSPGQPFTRRLWASGSVSFAEDWKSHMQLLVGRRLHCRESITDVRLKGGPREDGTTCGDGLDAGDKIFVDISRHYTVKPGARVIDERRTLCFMPPKTADEIKADLEQSGDRTTRSKAISHLTTFISIGSN